MGLQQFTFDRMLMREFIDYPYALYRDDAQWVPPLRCAVLAQLEPGAEFFRGSGNGHQNYLAMSGSRIVGRITASIRPGQGEVAPVGSLGFFEAENDLGVAQDLIGTAVQWLRRQGAQRILGPVNFDIWHGYRLMTDGFGTRIFAGEPYNKPYYPELFERCGLAVKYRWHSFDLEESALRERFRRPGIERRATLIEHGYRFVPFETRRFQAEFGRLHDLISRSYAHFPGFTPISKTEFARLATPLSHAVLPGFAAFVENPDAEICGFAVLPLDLSDPLRAMRGRSGWLARLEFFRVRRRARRVLVQLAGLVPEEANKHSGLGAALIAHVMDRVIERGHSPDIAALISENSPALGYLRKCAAVPSREYALFEVAA